VEWESPASDGGVGIDSYTRDQTRMTFGELYLCYSLRRYWL